MMRRQVTLVMCALTVCVLAGDLNGQSGQSNSTRRAQVNGQLLRASESGDFVAVVISLANGAYPDTSNERGRKPLHLAAVKDHLAIAEALIRSGATLDAIDDVGRTPLHLAVESLCINMTEWLLIHGAKYNAADQDGKTPFDLARTNGNNKILHLFKIRFHKSLSTWKSII